MSEVQTQTTPNVETASIQEPIEVIGGSSPVSWDELSAVSNWRNNLTKNKEPDLKTAQRRKDEGDDLDEVLTEKGEAHGTEEKSSKEKTDEKEVKKETKEKDTKAKDTVANSKNNVKPLKFKNNGQDIEINSDALVSVKVDGKTLEIPVQEVINRYSQQRHLDDLFKKHKTEVDQFESSRTRLNDSIKQAHDLLANKKDLKGFTELLGESLGVDGQKLFDDAVEKIRQVINEEASLSPEELKLKRLEEENQVYRSKAEAEKTAKAEAAKLKDLETHVSTILDQKQMTKADFVEAYDALVKNGVPTQDISPDMVGKYWDNMKLVETISSKLTEINPELQGDFEAVEKLTNLAIQTQASNEEIAEVINQLYGNSAAKKLSKKITKTLKKSVSDNGPKRAGSDPLFFDDI